MTTVNISCAYRGGLVLEDAVSGARVVLNGPSWPTTAPGVAVLNPGRDALGAGITVVDQAFWTAWSGFHADHPGLHNGAIKQVS